MKVDIGTSLIKLARLDVLRRAGPYPAGVKVVVASVEFMQRQKVWLPPLVQG